MSKLGAIRRYTLIIEKIGRGQFPSFEDLKDYLHQHGFEVSARTIQRAIEQIRVDFQIEIKYDRDKNGYCIDYENSINFINSECIFEFFLLTNSLKKFGWHELLVAFHCKSALCLTVSDMHVSKKSLFKEPNELKNIPFVHIN